VRLDDAGDLVISPLTAKDIPVETVALKTELTEMLPFAPIVSLLIEVDQRTGFLDCFIHADGHRERHRPRRRRRGRRLLAHHRLPDHRRAARRQTCNHPKALSRLNAIACTW
jgi:hypothetical protein